MLISLTLAPLAKTQLKSEFLPILLRVNAYQFCIPFCFSTEQNRTNRVDWVRLGSVIELNRTHKKAPVPLCSIAETIELQSNDWVRLVFGSVSFDWLRRVMKRGGQSKMSALSASRVCQSNNECCSFVICLTTEHIRALKNSFKCVRAIQIEFEFGIRCWFLKRGETGVKGEKPLGARERTSYKLLVFISQSGENTLTFNQKH